jgi:hypothetical protein
MSFKQDLFHRIWKEKDKTSFEQWIYNSNSIDFESAIGDKLYLEIITEINLSLTLREMKSLVFDNLPTNLKTEYRDYINRQQSVIKAKCIKTECLNYDGNEIRNWELEVGKEYYIIGISVDLKKPFHQISFQIFDPSYSATTPYFIPAELFEINDKIIPENYVLTFVDNAIQINPAEFVDKTYAAVEYSFWEDYFDDHEKAVKIFKATIDRLDIDLENNF